MVPKISFGEIAIGQIVFNRKTQLFPFSPRYKIDQSLVDRLKLSIRETGNWQPIVVQAETFEGIAGNHRFLAIMQLGVEAGYDLQSMLIPVVFVECDEGMAVAIALAENEHRVDLTQLEVVRGLIKAAAQKPTVVETVFSVDGMTIEQLRLWEDEFDQEMEIQEHPKQLRRLLTREWVHLIHARLAEYPKLHTMFLNELRHPAQIQAESLEQLDHAITRALLEHGRHFDGIHTWNSTPTFKCLGCRMNSGEFRRGVEDGSLKLSPVGIVSDACPHLRVFTKNTPQFVPDPNGTELIPYHGPGNQLPQNTLTDDNLVRGRIVNLLDHVDAYCVDPAVRQQESCFQEREADAAKNIVEMLQANGLPAVLPSIVAERQNTDQFIWLEPIRNEQACTPETCVNRQGTPPGFMVIARKDGGCQIACVHAECGGKAKAALEESEGQRRRVETERNRLALDALRQKSIEQTLFLPDPQRIEMLHPAVLAVIESVLVANWDRELMTHVVIGWQLAMRTQIANEMRLSTADSRVLRALRERAGQLSERLTPENVMERFSLLRTHVVETIGLERWIVCLATVRGWKEQAKNPAVVLATVSDPLSAIRVH